MDVDGPPDPSPSAPRPAGRGADASRAGGEVLSFTSNLVAHADEVAAAGSFPGGAWAVVSVRGHVRQGNEDRAGVFAGASVDGSSRPPVFVVADGLGGHRAGEVAAGIAVDTTIDRFASSTADRPRQMLRAAARQANAAVYSASFEEQRFGMASTLTAASVEAGELVVAHVGDSRAYLVRDGAGEQLTTDHSQVAEMVRMGLLSPEQAAHHPGRSVLTRCLGSGLGITVELVRRPLRAGDRFVLCSDGLWSLVTRDEVASVLGARDAPVERGEKTVGDSGSPAVGDSGSELARWLFDCCQHLVRRALELGAPDNVTVVLVAFEDGCPWLEANQASRRRFRLFDR